MFEIDRYRHQSYPGIGARKVNQGTAGTEGLRNSKLRNRFDKIIAKAQEPRHRLDELLG